MIFAYVLIGTNSYLCFVSNLKFPYFPLVFVFIIIALLFYVRGSKKQYSFNHSVWHVLSAAITLLCILGYVN